LKKIAKKIYL